MLRSSLVQLSSAAAAAADASAACLSPDAVSVLAGSFTRGLLQHFNLYQLVFTRQQAHTQHQFHLPVSLLRASLLFSGRVSKQMGVQLCSVLATLQRPYNRHCF
jgi:hypothetical protein